MISSFNYAAEQIKADAFVGEKLFEDTEKFFSNNKLLRTILRENSAVNKPKAPAKKIRSTIY